MVIVEFSFSEGLLIGVSVVAILMLLLRDKR